MKEELLNFLMWFVAVALVVLVMGAVTWRFT